MGYSWEERKQHWGKWPAETLSPVGWQGLQFLLKISCETLNPVDGLGVGGLGRKKRDSCSYLLGVDPVFSAIVQWWKGSIESRIFNRRKGIQPEGIHVLMFPQNTFVLLLGMLDLLEL